jgi:hypothetical protein
MVYQRDRRVCAKTLSQILSPCLQRTERKVSQHADIKEDVTNDDVGLLMKARSRSFRNDH